MDFREGIHDIFKAEGLSSSESNKAIFAIATIGLLIGKENLLNIAHSHCKDMNDLKESVYPLMENNAERKIFEMAVSFISLRISPFMFSRAVEIVVEFDLKHIVLNLSIYEALITKYEGTSLSSIDWINELVIELFKLHGGKSIYNYDCGTGDFIVKILQNGYVESAIGTTRRDQDAQIALIKKYFLHRELQINETKSFFMPALKEKVDMVFCTLPLIYRYEKEEAIPMIESWGFYFEFKRKYSANLLWIINALQSIKDDGMVISFVADGVLFNGIDEEIRKYLLVNNYIDAIISLPVGIIPSSNVLTSLIILKKNRQNNASIKMIDTSVIFTKHRRYKYFSQANISQIIDLYKNDENSDYVMNVPINEILANNSYLGTNRYFTIDVESAVTLESVTNLIFRGYQLNAKELDKLSLNDTEKSRYRIINISDIQQEGYVSEDLRPIKFDPKKNYNKYIVEDGDIIITAKNSTIKSAIYRSKGDYKDVLSGNLIAIRVDRDKISPFYLKAFIDSEKGDAAIKSIQTGTSITTITVNGLKEMKISLLPTEEQVIIGNEYKKNLEEIIDLMQKYKVAAEKASHIFDKYSTNT